VPDLDDQVGELGELEYGGSPGPRSYLVFQLVPIHVTSDARIDEYGGPAQAEAIEPGSVMSTMTTAMGPRGFGMA
jgi:hypothetical protein